MHLFKFHCFDILDSTQKYAIRRAPAHMSAILAIEQSSGVGKPGSIWHSPPGNLYVTYVLPLSNKPNHSIIQATTVAVLNTLHQFPCEIKWLNDVTLNNKKLSGIICDKLADSMLIGIGINLKTYNDEYNSASALKPTSILHETGVELGALEVAEVCGQNLVKALNDDANLIRSKFGEKLMHKGQLVKCECKDKNIYGIVKGISEDGKLIIEANGLEIHLIDCKIVLN